MARRKTQRKRTTRKRSRKSSPSLNASQKRLKERQVAPWERIEDVVTKESDIFTIPWEMRYSAQSMKNFPGIGYVGKIDMTTKEYASKPYSWERYILSAARGEENSPYPEGLRASRFVLRDDQEKDKNDIIQAYQNGAPQFLVANATGTGKTVTIWSSIKSILPKSVLIVCPSAVIPVWQKHIKDMGDCGIEVVVINYESLKKLIRPPQSAINAKKTSTQNKHIALHGDPYTIFDIVVLDEAHKVKNPTSQQSRIAQKFCENAKFSIYATATPGKDPSQLHYLWRGLSYATKDTISVKEEKDFSQYISWCKRNGINGVTNAPFGNGIIFKGGTESLENMSNIIYKPNDEELVWSSKTRLDTTKTQRESLSVQANEKDKKALDLIVQDATDLLIGGVSKNRKDLSSSLAKIMSFRQKCGALKAQYAVDYAKYCVDDLGEQVVISTIFTNTTETICHFLEEKSMSYCVIDGTVPSGEKESYRHMFQTGDVDVIVTSLTTGISLHANEDTDSSANPRRMIVVDLHWSPTQHLQLEGRINRNGEHGIISVSCLEDSLDEKIASRMLSGIASQSVIQDDREEENSLRVFAKEMGIDIES